MRLIPNGNLDGEINIINYKQPFYRKGLVFIIAWKKPKQTANFVIANFQK